MLKLFLRWTGIPVAKLVEGEREKLLNLEEEFNKTSYRSR